MICVSLDDFVLRVILQAPDPWRRANKGQVNRLTARQLRLNVVTLTHNFEENWSFYFRYSSGSMQVARKTRDDHHRSSQLSAYAAASICVRWTKYVGTVQTQFVGLDSNLDDPTRAGVSSTSRRLRLKQ
jgi:hypothetical protein